MVPILYAQTYPMYLCTYAMAAAAGPFSPSAHSLNNELSSRSIPLLIGSWEMWYCHSHTQQVGVTCGDVTATLIQSVGNMILLLPHSFSLWALHFSYKWVCQTKTPSHVGKRGSKKPLQEPPQLHSTVPYQIPLEYKQPLLYINVQQFGDKPVNKLLITSQVTRMENSGFIRGNEGEEKKRRIL